MRKLTIIALLLVSVCSPAQAQPRELGLYTGNDLLTVCDATNDGFRRGLCVGFIGGVADISSGFRFICYPEGVTNGQILDVVIAGLRNHPEERQKRSSVLVLKYLQAAFPCGKPK